MDRRFNRVRYDGDRKVEAFAARLKGAVGVSSPVQAWAVSLVTV